MGTTLRSNGYSHQYNLGIEGGYALNDMIWLGMVVDVLQSMHNGDREDPANNFITGLYLNNQEYIAWGMKLFTEQVISGFGFSAALFGAFAGNYVARAPALNVGIYYRI
jgi:hypothetical protein